MEKVHVGGGIFYFLSWSSCLFTLHVKLEMAKDWLRCRWRPSLLPHRHTFVNVCYPQISLKESLKFKSGLERKVKSHILGKWGVLFFRVGFANLHLACGSFEPGDIYTSPCKQSA